MGYQASTRNESASQKSDSQSPSTSRDQLQRLIYQILVSVFAKDPALLMQASLQTGVRLDKGDAQQISYLVKSMTQRLMRYPTKVMI